MADATLYGLSLPYVRGAADWEPVKVKAHLNMTDDKIEKLMTKKVEALTRLPESDKSILLDALTVSYGHAESLIPVLSIFSDVLPVQNRGAYKYVHVEGDLFCVSIYNKSNSSVFFTNNKKLIYGSRHYLTHLHSFVDDIDPCLEHVDRFDISQATDIGSKFVTVEKWFPSYGHFKDEAYTAGNFMRLSEGVNEFRALIDYPTDDHIDTSKFQFNDNYKIIDKLIFGNLSLNIYKYGDKVLKLNDLILLFNGFGSDTFHSFPPEISGIIKQKISDRIAGIRDKRIFITRSDSYRDIENKSEVEQFALDKGFKVINPEHIAYTDLVNALAEAETVIMYYGSAMTNMIYTPKGTRVVILKSRSYMGENLDLWSKVIKNYEIKIKVINAIGNVVDLDDLELSRLTG